MDRNVPTRRGIGNLRHKVSGQTTADMLMERVELPMLSQEEVLSAERWGSAHLCQGGVPVYPFLAAFQMAMIVSCFRTRERRPWKKLQGLSWYSSGLFVIQNVMQRREVEQVAEISKQSRKYLTSPSPSIGVNTNAVSSGVWSQLL